MKSLIIVIFTFILGLGAFNIQNSFASKAEKPAACHVADDKSCKCSCTDCAEGTATCETCSNCKADFKKASASADASCCAVEEAKAECKSNCEKACSGQEGECSSCVSCCG